MTNLQIQMMIHYYCSPEPYALNEPDHASSTAVATQRCQLVEWDMLAESHSTESGYDVTARGRAYVDALQAMPLPVMKWYVPLGEMNG